MEGEARRVEREGSSEAAERVVVRGWSSMSSGFVGGGGEAGRC